MAAAKKGKKTSKSKKSSTSKKKGNKLNFFSKLMLILLTAAVIITAVFLTLSNFNINKDKTPMTEVVSAKYDKLIAEGITPIKRWGTPEDVANCVVAAASGLLDFGTGTVLNADGGFHIRRL